jgi:hypothetical protein
MLNSARKEAEQPKPQTTVSPLDAKADSTVALVKHMNTFADAEGWISEESIATACKTKFHMTPAAAADIAWNTMFGADYRKIKGAGTKWQFFPPKLLVTGKFKAEDALGKFTHPHDTGFYHKVTGVFDEKLFDSACFDVKENPNKSLPANKIIIDRDPTNEDVKIIFVSKLLKYMKDNCQDKDDPRWENESSFYKTAGKYGNQGEFSILTSTSAVTIWRKNNKSEWERCIRLDDLKAFYKDTPDFLSKNENGAKLDPNNLQIVHK